MSPLCLLFDLDGTLVLTGGAGMRAFNRAFKEVFPIQGLVESVSPAGKTDPAILREVCLLSVGRNPTPGEEKEVFDKYLHYLGAELRDSSSKFRVMPGIKSLLETLSRNKDCRLGLGTGNLRDGARIKLEKPDLWRFFSFGGFGSDASERPRLLEIARERGRQLLDEGDGDFSEVYVIGDTPSDIRSGQAIGARTLAVATGPYSMEELVGAGADRAYSDFSDYTMFLKDLGLD